MKSKRGIALLIAIVMLLTLGACSKTDTPTNNNDTATTDTGAAADIASIIPKDTVELTVYTQLANYSGAQIGWSAEIMLERFNTKVLIINEADGTFATRMASGNLGDLVIFGNDGTDYLSAVEAGMLYDWNEDELLAEYGPYINANMQKALEKNRTISGTGKVYGFGHDIGTSTTDYSAFMYHPDIRWDLYAQLGYPAVNTLEDYVGVLEQMVALEPVSETGKKTYGASLMPEWDGNMVMFVKSTAALYGYDEFGFGLYDTKNQTFQDVLDPDGMYLRCLKFYNSLYQKGLLDPDSMTQTYNDMIEDFTSGAAFFNIFNWMGSGAYNTPEHLDAGKAMLPLAAADAKNIAYGLNVFGSNRVWSIGSKTNYPELCMAIINWFATPEGVMTYNYGPQGLLWDYDSNNAPYLTDLGFACQMDNQTQITYGNYTGTYKDGQFQHNNTVWAVDALNPDSNEQTYNWRYWTTTQDLMPVSEIEQQWKDTVKADNYVDYLASNGHISVSIGSQYAESSKSAELNTTWEQIKEEIKSGSWSAIYASSDAEYDKIVSEMRNKVISYGYEECIDWCKQEAEARKARENEARN